MWASAIVPAHNEAARIGKVLDVLRRVPNLQEIIVIDDGSIDFTNDVAHEYGATVIRNESRRGKGQALEYGVRRAQGNVLFFCDADIEGLTPRIVEEIIGPVLRGEVEMSIGARKSKVRHLGFGYAYSPLLDGQRALTRELWERIPQNLKSGFRVEAALNFHARTRAHQLFEISQVTKEEKLGFLRGRFERYLMYGDVFLAHIQNRLQIK